MSAVGTVGYKSPEGSLYCIGNSQDIMPALTTNADIFRCCDANKCNVQEMQPRNDNIEMFFNASQLWDLDATAVCESRWPKASPTDGKVAALRESNCRPKPKA